MIQQKFYNAKDDFALICDMSKELNLCEKTVELLFSRGLTTKEKILKFFNPTKEDFNNPFLLSGMKEATDKIKNAIENKKRILIFGDYDVDGVSATAIMLKTLSKLGVSAQYYLPNRFVDGYGLTNAVIDKINANFAPELIITVDCGISCKNEVDYAKSLGIDVIVTDHHEIPAQLPNSIIVNPKILNQPYPFHDLCGTGVAFKISQALLGNEEAEEFLPIAAIATIADIVSLTSENRAIVSLGLQLFEKYLPIGLKSLFKENKVSIKNANSTDIAFKIAPKLNSSGRMGDAADSLKLYLETNPVLIKAQIAKIVEHNTRRQKACNDVYDDCVNMLKDVNLSSIRAIVLCSKKWDSGILGIVCARLVETYNRPAFLFSEEDGVLKGSARSLQDVNVHELLSSMQDILETFGGHKMAAGLCLKKQHFKEFASRVNNFILSKVSSKAFMPIYYYDLDIEESIISDKFLSELEKFEPFGLNNSKPLFKISSSNAKISQLKNFSTHYNINIGKLSLLYFNCTEKYFSLKYAKRKNVIFEIQNKQGSLIKGIVKNFDGGFELDKSFSASLDAFAFEQLKYLGREGNCKIEYYDKPKLIELLAECNGCPFGTIFVSTRSASYRSFVEDYTSKNISDLFVFNNSSDSAYNALYLYPTNLNTFKNYKKIVFLEPVLDKSYLNEISKKTKATIFLPSFGSFPKKLFSSLNLSRAAFADFFVKLKQFNGQKFLNLSHLYNSICKSIKIPFNCFYIYYLVLSELEIIKVTSGETLTLEIQNGKKTDLSKSKILSTVNFLKQINK